MSLQRLFIVLFSLVVLGACSTTLKTNITAFHQLPPPQGQTFIVVAQQDAKEGSLELQNYARIVSSHLQAEGFRPTGTATPDLVVEIDYIVSQPIEKTRRSGGYYPYYGGFFYHGFGHHGFHRSHFYYHPFYRHYGYGFSYYPYDYSYTVYEHAFIMEIERNDGRILYEAEATAISRAQQSIEVVPTIIDAMFVNFPGQSGRTETVKLEMDDSRGGY